MKTTLVLLLALMLLLLLTACGTPVGTRVSASTSVVKAVVAKTNDIKMDKSRRYVCGNTYRAEVDAITRWNITGGTFKTFCGRAGKRETR